MLAALGLGPAEEEIYRLLVARGRAAVHELAADGGRPESEVREVLTDLAGRGLVVRLASEGAVTRYLAAPPAVALGGELRRRRDELSAAEHAVLTLAEQHRTGAEGGAVEVISDIDAVRHRFRQLQESARQQVRAMMVPEQTVVSRSDNVAEGAGVRRGVLYRTILHREALTEPGALAQALGALEAGQQVRVADAVPVKLMIADHELAMLPLFSGRNTAAASVLVHVGGLLDALVAYFELAWEHAYPLSPHTTGDGVAEQRADAIDAFDARMLALVLAGLTDQAVGARLGVSRRTVQRRIGELMTRAGVESRIQLGWHAARRGWA
ncbi:MULTISPECIES: helix-turn-helix domain-containing protein [unclassified Streptomyces]|uniref:helix-turn-helix domain-containing protein n=1 Tax=unclassified Streptomyces TaxID=2593676 RepID=UPI002DDC7EE8|nr:helix-turn-helix domain-containing protein [Streptomyces sp. NBC_00151]WRZ43925.1 helix-turn-helix domain-containing protein [Streptomyces sp. NBC_00151]